MGAFTLILLQKYKKVFAIILFSIWDLLAGQISSFEDEKIYHLGTKSFQL